MGDFHLWDDDKRITDVADLTDDMLLAVALDPDGMPSLKAAALSLIKTKLAVPVKATGAEVDTGTDDELYVTPKAIADSSIGDGVPRWIGPKRIYAVQNQTLAVTSNPRAATGDFTFGVNPSNADTMPAINGFSTIAFKTVAVAFPDIQIGIDLPTTLATLASELEANKGGVGNELLADLTFTADATHLLIAQTTAGTGGNATTLGTSTANIVRSGATLTGGNDGGDFTVLYGFASGLFGLNDGAFEGDTLTLTPTIGDPEIWTYRGTPTLPFEIDEDTDGSATIAALNSGSAIVRASQGLASAPRIIQRDGGAAAFAIATTVAGAVITQPSGGIADAGESDPITFNDNAASFQAALEAIPALTGHVTVTGDMPTSSIVLDSAITVPLLFVLATNNLVDGAGAGAVAIYIKDADILTTLVTSTDGDVIGQVIIKAVEPFGASASASILMDGESYSFVSPAVITDSPSPSGYSPGDSSFPHPSEGGPVVLKIAGAGGSGNTTGTCDVWYEIATPVPSA